MKLFKKLSDWFAAPRPMAASLILYPPKREVKGRVVLTLKEAMAVACIIDFHNKKSNMTLHCVEVVARRAVENINSQMGNREVRISDEDIT
jgi:hypothetical protein